MRSIDSFCSAFPIAVLLGAFVPSPSHAASTSAGAFVPGFGLVGEDSGPEDASVVLTLPSGDFEATAAVAHGVLAARARYEVDAFSRALAFGSTIAIADAQAIDTITITGGTGAGTLVMTLAVDGFGFESDPGIVRGRYRFHANAPNDSFSRSRFIDGVLVGNLVRSPISFVFGEPFFLSLGLSVEIEQIQAGDPPPYRPLVASFEYGAEWTGSAVFDAHGDPVPGFAISAESGSAYPVPEPEAGALALASVAALRLASRRFQPPTR